MTAERILVVEDDQAIGSELVNTLRAQGYQVEWAPNVVMARRLASGGAELVLLDLGLPDGDGVALCRELRRRVPDAVIVALTARTAELDTIVTLDAGADDYLTKPFRLSELLARVRAHLRRRPVAAPVRVQVGELSVNLLARTADMAGRPLVLRPKEFDLLAALATRADRVVTREDLMSEVWDEHWFGSTKTLDVHIAALRRRLAQAGNSGRIATVRGRGYRYLSSG